MTDLTEKKTTEIMNKYGAFFAFSDKQFNEAKNPEIPAENYRSLFYGIICPAENCKTFTDEMLAATEEAEKLFMQVNDRTEIIKQELSNYECYYVGDPTEAIENLKRFNISAEEIEKVFHAQMKIEIEAGNI